MLSALSTRWGSVWLLAPALLIALLCSSLASGFLAATPGDGSEQGTSTYYGHIPGEMWAIEPAEMGGGGWNVLSYRIKPGSVRTNGSIAVIGNHDGTRVAVYRLPDRSLLGEYTLNKMENATVTFPNGTFFKVVADKPATVISYQEGWSSTTFFTSTDGSYVGNEFIFQTHRSPDFTSTGQAYMVYALEPSEVTISDREGAKVTSFKLKANEVYPFGLKPSAVHRLASTGKVLFQSFAPGGLTYYPSIRGGFIGDLFYGGSHMGEWITSPATYLAVAGQEASELTIYDLEFKKEQGKAETKAGALTTLGKLGVTQMAVKSDRPVLIAMQEPGVAYACFTAGQSGYLYVPTGNYTSEAHLFAAEETTLVLDDMTMKLPQDEIVPIKPGLHKFSTTGNIVVQVASWWAASDIAYSWSGRIPSFNRLSDFFACIPSAESMSIKHEDLGLTSLFGGELPYVYIAAAAIVVILAAVAVWRLRRKPQV